MADTHKGAVEGVREFIRLIHGRCWLLHQSGQLAGSPGLPDIFCIAPGVDTGKRPTTSSPDSSEWAPLRGPRAFWVEIKVGKDRLSADQAAFKVSSEQAGVPVIVGTAGDVADALGYTKVSP